MVAGSYGPPPTLGEHRHRALTAACRPKEKPRFGRGLRFQGINVNEQPCASLVRLFYGFARGEPRPERPCRGSKRGPRGARMALDRGI
jgi:hypothetical protein